MKSLSCMRLAVTLCLAAGSYSAQAQLQLTCSLDWSALAGIDAPHPDKVILGVKARDWTKDLVDQMMAKEEECFQTSTDPESLKKARLAVGGWAWNKFVRNRCPHCKSTRYDTLEVTEVDRWRGTKTVTEKHSRGTNTRNVQTTYVQMLFQYRCQDCRHEWEKQRKEELGSEGTLGRFLSGY